LLGSGGGVGVANADADLGGAADADGGWGGAANADRGWGLNLGEVTSTCYGKLFYGPSNSIIGLPFLSIEVISMVYFWIPPYIFGGLLMI